MIQRILNSKNFLAIVLAMTTGTLLYFKMPWPMTASRVSQTWNEYFLRLIALRDPWSYAALKASYHILLFTTPYIGYSLLLSSLYIFTLRSQKAIKPQPLPPYPTIETRDQVPRPSISFVRFERLSGLSLPPGTPLMAGRR